MSNKSTQQAQGKKSEKGDLDDEKKNTGTRGKIDEQEKSIREQQKYISEQESSISSQNDSIKELWNSIKGQEADLQEKESTFDQSKSIKNIKRDLDNQKNEIQKKKKSTESSNGEKSDEDIERENNIKDMKRILQIQESVIVVQRRTFEEQRRNIRKEWVFIEEQKGNIEKQGKTNEKQTKNIGKQKEFIENQKTFLKDLETIINEQEKKKMEDVKSPSLDCKDIQGLEEILKKMTTKLKNCSVNIKVGITGFEAGVMMIIAALLVSWCKIIDKDTVCERGNALKKLGVSFSCRHQEVKSESESFLLMGIISFVADFIILMICMIVLSIPAKHRNVGLFIVHILFVGEALVLFSLLFHGYDDFSGFKTPKTMDYGQLKKVMLNSLTQDYKSDNITSNDIISNNWNTFFITYDCCAVNQVLGTTNDFDTTPWCTTSGSCQQTNSQIPRTCCKDVTENDYLYASPTCHATVSAGTYKEGCLTRIRSLSDVAIQESDINAMIAYVLTLGMIKVTAFFLNLVMAGIYCFFLQKGKSKQQTKPNSTR